MEGKISSNKIKNMLIVLLIVQLAFTNFAVQPVEAGSKKYSSICIKEGVNCAFLVGPCCEGLKCSGRLYGKCQKKK
ncbi:unnamed protein product [Amaranthus hypochondriacus]